MEPSDILVGGRVDDVWDERWKALSLAIDTMLKDYGQVPDAPRLKTLRPLLLCLQAFAGKRFADFHDGFLTQRLETWPDFPPDAVFSSILDQIGFDIAVIDRAILQRVSGTSLMQDRLALADRLAWSALQLAVNAGLLRPEKLPTVVTYFQKSPDIRVIPYAPVALLGIPYSAQQLDRDLLATPHEVGHYVFGHGFNGNERLRKYLRNQLEQIVPDKHPNHDLLSHWLEEIFADVYGVCVAGPVMALDFQDLQLNAGRERFITDDNDHPTPVLRPRIHLQVLHKRNPESWAAWADVLAHYWEVRLQERERIDRRNASNPPDIARQFTHFRSKGRQVDVAEIISESASFKQQDTKPLDQLVTTMLEVLKPGETQPWYPAWSGVPAAESPASERESLAQTTERLYTAFREFLFDPPAVEPDSLDPLLNVDPGTEAGRNTVLDQWLDADLLEFPTGDLQHEVKAETWAPYFEADGWTTEGPQDRWP